MSILLEPNFNKVLEKKLCFDQWQVAFNFVHYIFSNLVSDGSGRAPLDQLPMNISPTLTLKLARSIDDWRTTRNWPTISIIDSHDGFLDSPWKKAMALPHFNFPIVHQSLQPIDRIRSAIGLDNIFNKPIHKKADRELLIGIPSKLHSHYYQVVDENFAGGSCNHIDKTSRHRYRRPPSKKPSSFWDLGFPDEW